MSEQLEVKELEQVVVRFSGDSGDGMQLAGSIFSTVSATVGNGISTFPDYPADIRAPQGSLTGVSGYQVHIGTGRVYTPGDLCDVLVAMNAAALKTQYRYSKPQATIIIDTDSFGPNDLKKAEFNSDGFAEMVFSLVPKHQGRQDKGEREGRQISSWFFQFVLYVYNANNSEYCFKYTNCYRTSNTHFSKICL